MRTRSVVSSALMKEAFSSLDTRSSVGTTRRSEALSGEIVDRPWNIREEWAELQARADGSFFYQSAEWCESWLGACADSGCPERARIVTVRDGDGRLVLVWPLTIWTVGPTRILRALGAPVTQYADVLLDPDVDAAAVLRLAFETIAQAGEADAILLKGVRADGAFARHHGAAGLKPRIGARYDAPFLLLARDAAGLAPPALRSGKSLNALKRHQRQLEKHGPVRVETVEPCAQAAAIKEALALKHVWLKERNTTSAGYLHPANTEMLLRLARMHRFTIFRLMVGAAVGAIEIGVLEKGRYLSMIQSYDQRFSKHAPGRLLLLHIFQDRNSPIELFDFMPPDLPHKSEWAEGMEAVADYSWPLTRRGRVTLAYLDRVRPLLVRGFLAMPEKLRGIAARFAFVRNG